VGIRSGMKRGNRLVVTLGTLDVMQRDIRHLRNKISIEPGRITITGRIILRGNL
jgi:hypothetical protein